MNVARHPAREMNREIQIPKLGTKTLGLPIQEQIPLAAINALRRRPSELGPKCRTHASMIRKILPYIQRPCF